MFPGDALDITSLACEDSRYCILLTRTSSFLPFGLDSSVACRPGVKCIVCDKNTCSQRLSRLLAIFWVVSVLHVFAREHRVAISAEQGSGLGRKACMKGQPPGQKQQQGGCRQTTGAHPSEAISAGHIDNRGVTFDPPPPLDAQTRALVQAIDAVLPQTQCTRCGFPDCHAYASAIAQGEAPINQCPPGGNEGIERLARITGQSALALNPDHGHEGPRHVALIDEEWCIGCTLCIKACPVDSIMGAPKLMHTVLTSECTGCELCIPVCPVDCISLENVSGERTGWQAWSPEHADRAHKRYQLHQARTQRTQEENDARLAAQAELKLADWAANSQLDPAAQERKRLLVEAAMARNTARVQARDKP